MAKNNGSLLTEHRLDKIDDHLDRIDSRLTKVEDAISGIRTTIRVAAAIAAVLAAFLIGVIGFSGKSVMRDIAREVYREEVEFRSTISQDGTLSTETEIVSRDIKTSTIMTRRFRWPLSHPVDAEDILSIRMQPRILLPGVAISAELAEGGKACVITLKGPASVIEPALPIDATIFVETRR